MSPRLKFRPKVSLVRPSFEAMNHCFWQFSLQQREREGEMGCLSQRSTHRKESGPQRQDFDVTGQSDAPITHSISCQIGFPGNPLNNRDFFPL